MPAAPRGLTIRFTAIRTNARIKPIAPVARALDRYAADFAARLILVVREYPEPPPYSDYIRTNRLFKAWNLLRLNAGDAIRYQITNFARDTTIAYRSMRDGSIRHYPRANPHYYAAWVHGPSRQRTDLANQGWKNVGEELRRLDSRRNFRAGVQDILSTATSEFTRAGIRRT